MNSAPAGVVGNAERMIAWSAEFDRRIAKTVEHCDRMVGSSSAGPLRHDAEKAPYLRLPSRCRAMEQRVGPKPKPESAGT